MHETVHLGQAGQGGETVSRDTERLLQLEGRFGQRITDVDRCNAPAGFFYFTHRNTAGGERRYYVIDVAVHGVGDIRDTEHRQAEGFDQLLHLFHIGRGQVGAGEQGHLILDGFAFFRQRGDDGLHRVGVPFLQRAAVIRRGGPDDRNLVKLGIFLAEVDDGTAHVIPHSFGQAGSHHSHHLGSELLDHPFQPFFQVFPAAEDGGILAHGGGVEGNGFLVVSRKLQANKGGTALGAVQQGQHVVNAEVGHGGAQSRRVLLRVDSCRFFRHLHPR